MFVYNETLFKKEHSTYSVHIRLTSLANEYLLYLKEKTKMYKTDIVLLLVNKNKDILLSNDYKISNRPIKIHIKVDTKEKSFYNKQINKNIAYMLDEIARSDKEFKKYKESVLCNNEH